MATTKLVFSSLQQIKDHSFVGNYHDDSAAMSAIDTFVRDTRTSEEDAAQALWHMGRAAMGLNPEENLEHLSPAALLKLFHESCSA